TDAATEEDPDHGLGFGRDVRPTVGQRGTSDAVLEEESTEGEAGEAHAGVGEEGAARDAGAALRLHESILLDGVAEFLEFFEFEKVQAILHSIHRFFVGNQAINSEHADSATEYHLLNRLSKHLIVS